MKTLYLLLVCIWAGFAAHATIDCDSIKSSMSIRSIGSDVWVNVQTQSPYAGLRADYLYEYGESGGVQSIDSHIYYTRGQFTIEVYVSVYDSSTSTVVCRDTLRTPFQVSWLNAQMMGQVHYDSLFATGFTGPVMVSLLRYDSATTSLVPVDSQLLKAPDSLWFWFRYLKPGTYIVKAATAGDAYAFAGILPTYDFSTLYWQKANVFVADGLSGAGRISTLIAQAGEKGVGIGRISGKVLQRTNSGSVVGAPGVSMVLTRAGGKVVAMTGTDSTGSYSFTRLPDDTYTVQPELLNFTALASTRYVLGGTVTDISGVDFTLNDAQRSITPGGLGIQPPADAELKLYPNPAHDFVKLSGKPGVSTTLEVRDRTGRTIVRASIPGGGSFLLDVRLFVPGLYFVHAGTGAPLKLVVE